MKWYYDTTVLETGKRRINGPFETEHRAISERSLEQQAIDANGYTSYSLGEPYEEADDHKESQPCPVALVSTASGVIQRYSDGSEERLPAED